MKNSKKFWLVALLVVVCLSALCACNEIQYKASFVVDGQAYGETQTLVEGSKVVKPADPTKSATAEYTYTFAGWYNGDVEWNFDTDVISADVTLTAKFNSEDNEIEVKFVNEDGTELSSASVKYGELVAEPSENPSKDQTAQYTFAFDGWYKGEEKWNFEENTVTESITLQAQFTSTTNKYVVIFKNGDTELQNTEVEYGVLPEYKGETPTKESSTTKSYTFSGWSPEIQNVDGAVTYVAQFEEAARTYEVVFDTDSSYEVESQAVEYNALLSAPEALAYKVADDKYYAFAGWYNGDVAWNFEEDHVTVDGLTLKAHWTELAGIHNATFDGSNFSLTKDATSTSYAESSYIELGDYENGGYVAISFTGRVAPQIAFFLSAGTSTMKTSATGCMLFTSDVVTTDYRMFPHTNPNTGAVMANKWNKGAFANLVADEEYVLVVSDVKGESKYLINLSLYKKLEDGSITLVEGGTYTCDYPITHNDLNNTGSKIVLFGSRHSNISGSVVVADTLEGALEGYTVVHTHYYSMVNEVAATCTTNGTKAHFTCSGCDKLFILDENDEYAEISAEELVIPAAHELGELVARVESTCAVAGHVAYYQCSACKKYFDENKAELATIELPLEAHTYGEWIAETPATTDTNGVAGHYHCSVCEKNFDANKVELETIVLPKLEHTYGEWINEVAATCESEGTLGHYHCTHCDKNFDKDYKEITGSLTISKLEHVYGDWTLTKEPTESATGTAERTCANCSATADGHTDTKTVPVLTDASVWTLNDITYTSEYGTVTMKIYKATYDAETGALTTQACAGSTNYTDCSFVDLGEYANGGFVCVEFTGKYVPQIGFFLSGGTKTMKDSALGGLIFSTDAVGVDYRMWKNTNVTTGAILANKWKKAAYNNLTEDGKYVLVVGCVKTTQYEVTLALYTQNEDGSITLVEDGSYTGTYALTDSNITPSGTHLVLFGSRVKALSATITLGDSLADVTEHFGSSEQGQTIETYKATYDEKTGALTTEACAGSTNYTDCSYVDLGEYANGGFVCVEFTGKYVPQIGFFLSGGTKTMKESALGGLIFSTDAIGSDYRMWKNTNVTSGAILANKWNKAAYNNLTEDGKYVLVVGCVKSTKYEVTLALYTHNEDGSITLVEDGSYTGTYELTDSNITPSGTHLVLFGSRVTALNATITLGDSLADVTEHFGASEPDRTVQTYKSTYNAETGAATFTKCEGSTNYTDCSYIDFGEYANGGQVEVLFTGKYTPQIGFFLSGGTTTMKSSALGGLVFSTDAIGSDYRMWKCTDVTTGAILANKWNAAAYNNLAEETSYKLVVKLVKGTEKYEVYMALYTVSGETLTLVSEYSGSYNVTEESIKNSGTHIVLFGSRVTALNATVKITDSDSL